MDQETKGIETYVKDQDQEPTSNILFGFFQKMMALSWYKNDKNYNLYLFGLWMFFASILYSISFGMKSSQAIFVMYCCNIWVVMLAFLFLFIV
jgi:hypothetical protein